MAGAGAFFGIEEERGGGWGGGDDESIVRRPIQPRLHLGGHRYRDVSASNRNANGPGDERPRGRSTGETVDRRFGPGRGGRINIDTTGGANFVDEEPQGRARDAGGDSAGRQATQVEL